MDEEEPLTLFDADTERDGLVTHNPSAMAEAIETMYELAERLEKLGSNRPSIDGGTGKVLWHGQHREVQKVKTRKEYI